MKFYSKPNKLIQEERTEQLQTKNLKMVRWKIVVNIIYFVIFLNYSLSRKFYTEYFTVFTIYSYLKLNKEPKGGCMVVPILAMFSNYSQYGIYF